MAPFLIVDSLAKNYGATRALDGVSFEVQEGELFGLLGPNGAGKTTLLSILSCLMQADAGTAKLMGHGIRPGNRQLRRSIGIVPQELALYGELTARENLAFFGKLYGIDDGALQKRIQSVLAAIGLEARANDRVETFSGGMKRRLNLGAALVHEPRLILLDEPTTGVDPQSRNHIFDEIRRLNRAGVTIIYTSHYLEEVESLCSRIGIIDHGKLIALGTLAELVSRLEGVLTLELPGTAARLAEGLRQLTEARVELDGDGKRLRISHREVTKLVLPVARLLQEAGVEPTSLHVAEPTLERVFLQLTGRALRD
jgi:ABC-2 type transport system ATP-binding protein